MGQLARGGGEGEEHDGSAGAEPGLVLGGMDDLGVDDELVYDLDEWGERDLELLRDRLARLAVPHRWEGASLVVAASDEAWVERVLDQVDDDLSLALDPEQSQVAYDLGDWDDQHRSDLFEQLVDEAVPHGWDGTELFVHEIDEERVDELVGDVLGEGDGDEEGAGGARVDGQRAMGDLFVAADKLRSAPRGVATRIGFRTAAETAHAARPPYGIEPAWWSGTLEAADEVLALFDADDAGELQSVADASRDAAEAPDEDPVARAAAALRARLHPMV